MAKAVNFGLKPSFRGDPKDRTRNLGIPGSSLPRRPGMTPPNRPLLD